MRHLLCIGMGYTARHLAQGLKPEAWRISGSARSDQRRREIAALGFDAIVFDGTRLQPELARRLGSATHLLVSAAPVDEGDPLIAQHRVDLLRAPHLTWIGYLSTIGVYGDHGGGWVGEDTAIVAPSERGKRRLLAENQWRQLATSRGLRLQIFRLGGIYGPGRSALDTVRRGTARRIVKPGQVFNRIHVADIAQVLAAGLVGQGASTIYNLVDDEPAPPQDVVSFAAGLLGVAPPAEQNFDEAQLTAKARSFYADCKRVRNDRVKHDFNISLAYPTYRQGLRALAAAG